MGTRPERFVNTVEVTVTDEVREAAGQPSSEGWGVFEEENYTSTLRSVHDEEEAAQGQLDWLNRTEGRTEYDTANDPDNSNPILERSFYKGQVVLAKSEVSLTRVDTYVPKPEQG